LRPSLVERSKFNLLDRFQSSVIFGKLNDFADSSPDIVQVGDSSGFHGVRPEIVMRHLGGLKYVNLSCCAGMGYRGYYGIADFMLRRNPGIKAVVLYVSLNNLPRADLIGGQHQLGEFIQNSLTTPFAYLSPPSVALRQRIVDRIERKGQARTDAVFTDDMRQSTREHNGWWAEHDRRLAGEKHVAFWRQTCGATGIKRWDDQGVYYVDGQQSYMRTELERFASLAAQHGAKLVVLFHPFSCRGLDGSFLDARREDVRVLLKQHPNMVALPKQILEPWPTEQFVSADHLRVGYEEENSKRVGKLLAGYLGIAPRSDAPAIAETASVRRDAMPALSNWQSEGVVVLPDDEQPSAQRFIESAGLGVHRVETTVTGLTPGKTMLLSFPAKPVGARGILVELGSAGHHGRGYCDLYGGTAQRDGNMLDVGLEPQADGWSRCWVAMVVNAQSAEVRLGLLDERLDPAYVGNGRSGAAIGALELGEWARFLGKEQSPW
jgi:hypothetical protein